MQPTLQPWLKRVFAENHRLLIARISSISPAAQVSAQRGCAVELWTLARTGGQGKLNISQLQTNRWPVRVGSNGCLEAAAGIHSILNATGIGDNAPFGLLLAKLHKGDKVATRIVSRAGRLLGKALAIYCNLVDAPAIVLGGQYRLLAPT